MLVVTLVLAALALATLSTLLAQGTRTPSQPPDVVLLVTDDQRFDTLAGMPQVQRLLVRRGVTFSNAMVPTSLCCPSRATILTGLYAHHTRVFGNGDVGGDRYGGWPQFHRRGLESRTLATLLHRYRYRTGLFGKYLNHFGVSTPPGYRPPGWDNFTAFRFLRGAYFDYRLSDGTAHGRRPQDYSTDVLASRASAFITTAPRGRPLFVYLAPYGPHSPYTPAPRDVGAAASLPSLVSAVHPIGRPPMWRAAGSAPVAAEVDRVHRAQVEALMSVDDAVATVMRALRRAGRAGHTLFVLTSDNGYFWGEHGMIGKDAPYDVSIRVPLVVRWDGHVRAGTVDHRLALNVDLAGTIADAALARMHTDGLDLLGTRRRHGFVVEAMAGYQHRPAYCGWRTRTHLYVRWATGRTELYDYRTDPAESHNLAGAPAVAALQARMRAAAVAGCSPPPPGFSW